MLRIPFISLVRFLLCRTKRFSDVVIMVLATCVTRHANRGSSLALLEAFIFVYKLCLGLHFDFQLICLRHNDF